MAVVLPPLHKAILRDSERLQSLFTCSFSRSGAHLAKWLGIDRRPPSWRSTVGLLVRIDDQLYQTMAYNVGFIKPDYCNRIDL